MPVRLTTSDDGVFEVDASVIRQAVMIRDILDGKNLLYAILLYEKYVNYIL